MHKILVTGGLGFIGSNLIKILLRQKFIVINVDKVSYSSNFYNTKNFSNNRNYKFIKCDLRNKKKLKIYLINSNQIVFLILRQKHMLIDQLMVQRILLTQIFLVLLIF